MPLYSYEDLAFRSYAPATPHLIEAYRGVQIVKWHGDIERQLGEFLNDEDDRRNHVYADKLREFLKIWRAHPLTGSINIEDVVALTTPADMLAVDPWKYQNYFSNLRDSLRQLRASLEELPADGIVPPDERGPGAGVAPNSFGPTDKGGAPTPGVGSGGGPGVGSGAPPI